MIELDQMRDFVRDDVVGDRRRQLHEAPVQPDLSLVIAASPLRAGAGELYRRCEARHLAREMQHARCEQRERLFLEPAADEGGDFTFVARSGMKDRQMQQIGGDGLLASRKKRKRQWTAAKE